jgi:hypothetical protein
MDWKKHWSFDAISGVRSNASVSERFEGDSVLTKFQRDISRSPGNNARTVTE